MEEGYLLKLQKIKAKHNLGTDSPFSIQQINTEEEEYDLQSSTY